MCGQQDQIEALKATVQEILQRQPLNLTSNADAKPAVGLTNISLEQNTPNPVSNTTNVPYSIPQNAKNAQLIIRNNSGEMVRQLALPAGAGVASIDASVLSSGTYNYSLIVDGKIIRSRKMIVSH